MNGRGPTTRSLGLRGQQLTIVIYHLLTGMILQVGIQYALVAEVWFNP